MNAEVYPAGSAAAFDFQVARKNLHDCRFVAPALPPSAPLQADEVQLRIDKFAFTANNISHAVHGESLSYWQFFPAPEGWGRIPVWGFAEVLASRHPQVREGERLFGYLPMSTHLRLLAGKLSERSIQDVSAARASLSPVYSSFSRVLRDPGYFPARENEQALLRPLFMTAFLIDDFLDEQAAFGADQLLLSSASSKTALSLAFLLRRRRRGEVIGLTSAANLEFCQRSGYYDRVLAYEQLPTLAASRPTVFIDMAGDGELLRQVHTQFGSRLRHSCRVGGTHWKQGQIQQDLPGAPPEFFFAPSRLRKRQQDWGASALEERYTQAWRPFLLSVGGWMRVVPQRGLAAVEKVYRDALEGRTPPEVGYILSLA
ncbi:MAG: DUF2855 family protein [Nevskiaceae bacterium]|nr:MAG: DUF2855 family protein [Nevskiaceae bacterium]TAM32333.1 MAG: DUF2855 family protein [Nevskiaceae bacterium]